MFMLTMDQITMCNVKGLLVMTDAPTIIPSLCSSPQLYEAL